MNSLNYLAIERYTFSRPLRGFNQHFPYFVAWNETAQNLEVIILRETVTCDDLIEIAELTTRWTRKRESRRYELVYVPVILTIDEPGAAVVERDHEVIIRRVTAREFAEFGS
jgi:hypothetical protein